ncbi:MULTISPECIES: APC family permease [Nocardia]|uniref:APC family permease n=1 Tax=Nocardia implantans TaxID=3108168 RepID=A0ABU6AP84_9NOCA|nr:MULTISPECIES: APC family permease [unclassified Nocardia]MBF6192339.1 amino acid permease [Nocardia beijingensis]MEA3531092.1 APC family permease [Nocardia sp. CDC192]MEB3509182.1 APC family permease [Nocardia sp. CDC186]
MASVDGELSRRLGLADSVVIGLGAMVGAGIFAALAPAAAAAGSWLLVALAVAAVVAYCNATSSARLAARYPVSGGTYVYGRERLGRLWGYLAGWGFVAGKTASCAAMALTVGSYAWPEQAHAVAVGAVVAITAINYTGVQKSAFATRVLVGVVLAVLAAVIVIGLLGTHSAASALPDRIGPRDVLTAAGLLFFAFAGYARIATLGEEVLEPQRTIPRAIMLALALALAIYTLVAVATLSVLGSAGLAAATDPLARMVSAAGVPAAAPVVRIGAVLAAAGSLLALILGVSRTVLAMARDRYLPGALAAVHPRFGVPHRAELVVGAIVAAVAALFDVRAAIGFSSFTVLFYYLIANISAATLTAEENRPPRWIPVVGAVGCVVVAFALPLGSVLAGLGALALGAALYALGERYR